MLSPRIGGWGAERAGGGGDLTIRPVAPVDPPCISRSNNEDSGEF